MAKKKGEIQDLEEVFEEVDGQSSSITDLIEKNRTLLIGLFVGLIAVVSGILFYQYSQQSKNADANRELFRAIQYFEADSFENALYGDDQFPGFLEIEESYGGTDAANLAKYYLGIIYLKSDSNEVETGIDYLQAFDKKTDSPLAMGAYMALGFAHEELTDFEAAAGYFEDAIGSVGRENES
ncbi:MAG: cytochrome C biosynthesis protein, partial [Bacteroidota bacterium]